MQDQITGFSTCLCGARIPGITERSALLDRHRERLLAFDQLGKIAGECGIRADQDQGRQLFVFPEDGVSLLESADQTWSSLGEAIRKFRRLLPLVSLSVFGFELTEKETFESSTAQLRLIGRGVEALAFQSHDNSIYKFFLFREGGLVGSSFSYAINDEGLIQATAHPGNYRQLLEKLLLITQIGVPTEVVGISPEGVLIAKQMLGEVLPQGHDTSKVLPSGLIVIPSRFLRADRDHPRLYLLNDRPWLIADLHARNMVRCADGQLRVIDLVAGLWPLDLTCGDSLITDWLARVRLDPNASALPGARDEEL